MIGYARVHVRMGASGKPAKCPLQLGREKVVLQIRGAGGAQHIERRSHACVQDPLWPAKVRAAQRQVHVRPPMQERSAVDRCGRHAGGNRLRSPAFSERGVDDPIQHLGERRSQHGPRIGAGAGGLNR